MRITEQQMHSFVTFAVMLELAKRTVTKLEEMGKISTIDPEHRIKMNEAIVTKQIADAIVTQLNS